MTGGTFELENPHPRAGDALRDEAANLLATRYGRPNREVRAGGKKVDLSFEHRDFGKSVRIFVEAKDYNHSLQRSELVHIWADYGGLMKAAGAASLLVITRQGLTSDAQAFVEENSALRHQTIWELENEIFGLTDYVRSLTSLFADDGLETYYVAGRARAVSYGIDHARLSSGEPKLLFERVVAWLDDEADTQPIAVLGGYGAGKSSFAKRLVAHQARVALADPLARRPVLIKLGDFSRYSSLEGLLGGQFTHDFPIHGFNVHTFLNASDKGRLLIVLDGFDEMKHAMSWTDFRAQISSLNRLTHGKAKVVLLGRPSAFVSAEEHLHVLRGLKQYAGGFRHLPDWPKFMEFDLEPFSAGERADFVRGYLTYRAKENGETIEAGWIDRRADEVNRLADHDLEVFSKPVHAKILTDLAADPSVDLGQFANGVSRWELYDVFFKSLAEREAEKGARRLISEAQRLEFLREVAFWIWSKQAGQTAFSAQDLPDSLILRWGDAGAPDLDALKREYLTGAFLEKKSGDIYYFGHRSLAEFLVAQHMLFVPPAGHVHALYSDFVRDGVGAFLREAGSQPDLARGFYAWASTLAVAQGELHLEYFLFLAEMMGGTQTLIDTMPSTAIWTPVLECFGDKISWSGHSLEKLFQALRDPRDPLFFLVLRLIQIQCARDDQLSVEALAVQFAAALLDRVFETARYDDQTGKAPIDVEYADARALASSVLPEISDRLGRRFLQWRGARLEQHRAKRIAEMGTDLSVHGPVALRNTGIDLELDLFAVLNAMSPSNREKATHYFRRSNSLRNVFVSAKTVHRHADTTVTTAWAPSRPTRPGRR